MPTTTDRLDLVKPDPDDFVNTWPDQAQDSFDVLDTAALYIETTPRPAAGLKGRIHRAADGTLTFDNGTAWETLARHPHAALHAEDGSDPILGQVPIGATLTYAGSTLPPNGGYAWADGSLIDVAGHETFASRVGHDYNGGVDPGGGKVRVPDKRGRFLLGANNFGAGTAGTGNDRGQQARGASAGERNHALVAAEHASHTHTTVNAGSHAHVLNGAGAHNHGFQGTNLPGASPYTGVQGLNGSGLITPWTNSIIFNITVTDATGDHAHGVNAAGDHGHTINAQGSGTAHNNMPPGEADNVIVRVA